MAILERPELRDRKRVFRDRAHAGRVLAEALEGLRATPARLLAIPSGGVPVAAEIARRLGLPLSAAVSSKITPSWNAEMGCGAVAFDGTVLVDGRLARRMGLGAEELREGIRLAREKVRRRAEMFAEAAEVGDLREVHAILVDDGLASGLTMLAAVGAVRKAGASRISIAVPTGHDRSVAELASRVDDVYCPNVRGGLSFAVADAYEAWRDVLESEAADIVRRHREEEETARRGRTAGRHGP